MEHTIYTNLIQKRPNRPPRYQTWPTRYLCVLIHQRITHESHLPSPHQKKGSDKRALDVHFINQFKKYLRQARKACRDPRLRLQIPGCHYQGACPGAPDGMKSNNNMGCSWREALPWLAIKGWANSILSRDQRTHDKRFGFRCIQGVRMVQTPLLARRMIFHPPLYFQETSFNL